VARLDRRRAVMKTKPYRVLFENAQEILEEVLLEGGVFRVLRFQHCAKEASDLFRFWQKVNRFTWKNILMRLNDIDDEIAHTVVIKFDGLG